MARRCALPAWIDWLLLVLSSQAAAGCDPCGPREYFSRRIHGIFSDLVIVGQEGLYPTRLDEPTIGYYGIGLEPEDPRWADYLEFLEDPSSASRVLYGAMAFDLGEPYCDDWYPDLNLACGDVGMGQVIAGPKAAGEVFQVRHKDLSSTDIEPEPSAMYMRWTERKYYPDWGDFPEYTSVSVSGTATVTSEDPFEMDYDLHFLSAEGVPRDVKVHFHLFYFEYCTPYD